MRGCRSCGGNLVPREVVAERVLETMERAAADETGNVRAARYEVAAERAVAALLGLHWSCWFDLLGQFVAIELAAAPAGGRP